MTNPGAPRGPRRTPRNDRSRPHASAIVAVALVFAAGAGTEQTDLLRAPHGAPIKLIVREPAAIYEDSDPASESRPAAPFDFYYAYDPPTNGRAARARTTRNGFYYIAEAAPKGEPIGWIPAARVVVWPHRQALGFASRRGRRPALFYAEAIDLVQAYSGGAPLEARAISQEPSKPIAAGARPPLLPILEQRPVEIHGDSMTIYKVAYLHRPEGAAPTPAPARPTLDVAFVVDATGSMQDWIVKTIDAVSELSREIATIPELAGTVHFALVCYRDSPLDYLPARAGMKADYIPPDNFIVRTYCDLDEGADHQIFVTQTRRIFAEGGGQSPERVLDGLHLAITELAWRKGSYKHIVLIGNASTHVDAAKSGGLRIETVLREAQPEEVRDDPSRAITIHAIRVPTEDAADGAVCAEQFRRIAAGVAYTGLFQEEVDLQAFSRDLLALLRGRLKPIQALALGSARDEVIRLARSDRLIGPLLAMLRPEDGSNAAGFTTGYVADVDADGHRQVEPHLLVRRDQLEKFQAFLDSFALAVGRAGDPGALDVERLVADLQRNLGFLNLGESVDQTTPTREILQWVLDAPVRDPAFDLSPKVLATLTQEQFRVWKERVDAARAMVRERLEDEAAWVQIGRDTRASRKHSFVRVVDLP